jgi:hypothetical protein
MALGINWSNENLIILKDAVTGEVVASARSTNDYTFVNKPKKTITPVAYERMLVRTRRVGGAGVTARRAQGTG